MQDLNDKVTGGVLTAVEWNEVPSEIQNVIEGLGIVLSSGDLNQLGKSIAGYVANGTFYTDSGIADAYVLSVVGSKQAATAYTDGFLVNFIAGNDNAGASTVNVASLGVKNIVLPGGTALAAGDISGRIELSFDNANDRFELLNAKVTGQTFEFDSTVQMKSSAFVVAGMKAKTLGFTVKGDRGAAKYDTISGTGTANATSRLAHNTLSFTFVLRDETVMNIEMFSAVANADSSAAIREGITFRGAAGVIIPAKRYIYDGTVITDDVVVVHGEKMPTVNSGFTSLENGSILEGTFSTTAKTVDIRNFGADLGTATAATDGDGIKCTTALNAGIGCHAENVIALLKNKISPFHATLFESYLKFTGGNISGNHGFFGCVIKCQNVNLTSIYTNKNDSDGLFLKSDTTFGTCKTVNIDNIIVDGDATQDFGVRAQADDAELSKVNLGNVIVGGCATSIIAQTLTGVLTELNIGKAILDDPTLRGVFSQAGAGTINGFNINELFIINALDTGVEYDGSQKSVSIGYANIIYATGTTQTEWDKGVVVGSTVSGTSFDNVSINQLYSSVNLGSITYNNTTFLDGNKLGQYTALIKGLGKPLMGFSAPTDTGATVKVTPVYNTREKSSLVKAAPTANTIVTSFEFIAAGGTELYDTGYELTIINDSAFTYTVNNDLGGKILNKGAANVAIATNEIERWVFGGAVWHQV
jgi:hypothetical protein